MIVYCCGTHTDVGKTWVGAQVLAVLRAAGLTVAARKPVQSFDPAEATPTDADVLAAATGEPSGTVCPAGGSFPVPMAPPMAAAVLGRPPPTLAGIRARVVWPDVPVDVGWVEGVGGPRSPVAIDGDGVELATALVPGPDLVVLVADAGLGTINAVRLCMDAFSEEGLEPTVFLNRYDGDDDLHRRNLDWLSDDLGTPPLTAIRHLAARCSAGRLDDDRLD